MLDFATIVIPIDHLFSVYPRRTTSFILDHVLADGARFEGNLREISGKFVLLILRPTLKRMVVTLVAIEANPQKCLANVLRNLARLAQNPIIIGSGIFIRAALGQ